MTAVELDRHAEQAITAALADHPEVSLAKLAELARERQGKLRAELDEREAAVTKKGAADVMAAADAALANLSDDETARMAALDRYLIDAAEPETLGTLASELLTAVPVEPDWLIPHVAARGWMVKLAAREKVGKGTLIFYLLGRLERGEATVFGPATGEVTSLIYTEEPADSIREKVQRSGLQRARIVSGHELAGLDWPAKVERLVSAAGNGGHGVLFVDNVSRAAAVEDEAGTELARAAELLGDAARAAGLTTIIDHHHRKGAGSLDDKSRGGTALSGACDNNVEMVKAGGWDSRIRRLSSRGRLSSTIWERTIALTPDGTGYETVADEDEPQTSKERERLRVLIDIGETGVTAAEYAEAIGASDDTARRALSDLTDQGFAVCDELAYPTRWRAASAAGLPL